MRRIRLTLLQIGIFYIISILANIISDALHLPVPGTMLAIIVVFILLKTGVVKLVWLSAGADFLIANLVLFFIPSAVVLMKHTKYLAAEATGILLVVVLGTFLIMVFSGTLTEFFIARGKKGKA
ncbi:MAG: CidA/LrgA family protein [Gorillibacterium sp.]|nr:CidA/LrgA family protein [Gorillibacterium sp.]